MHTAISIHIAKRPKKFLMSKYSNMKGNSLLAVLSKNFENVPKAIPKSSIANVSIICLLTDIVFS